MSIGDKVYINGYISIIHSSNLHSSNLHPSEIEHKYANNLLGNITERILDYPTTANNGENLLNYVIYINADKYAIGVFPKQITKKPIVDYNIGDVVYFTGSFTLDKKVYKVSNLKSTIVEKNVSTIESPNYKISLNHSIILHIFNLDLISNKLITKFKIGDKVKVADGASKFIDDIYPAEMVKYLDNDIVSEMAYHLIDSDGNGSVAPNEDKLKLDV